MVKDLLENSLSEAEIKADVGFITSLTVKRVGGSGGNTHKVTFCTTNSVQP